MRSLFIASAGLPWPLGVSGGAQREGLLVRALQKWGDVDILVAQEKSYFEQPDVREKISTQREYAIQELELDFTKLAGPWRQLAPLFRGKLHNLLRDIGRIKANFGHARGGANLLGQLTSGGKYDVVVVRDLRCAMKAGTSQLSGIPVLLDYDDIDWQIHSTREESGGNRSLAARFRNEAVRLYLERRTRSCLASFAHVWVASEADRQLLGLPHCSVLPNVPLLSAADHPMASGNASSNRSLLFVATLGYGPNASGLQHFLRNIWPQVHQAHPDVRLQVVGKLPKHSPLVDGWKNEPNVDLLGYVENLDDQYAQALFTISPVYWGGGTKIKVLESLGRGRTCVATRHSLYGLEERIRHGDSVWCADTDEDFVQGCIALLEDPELRRRLETRGEDVVKSHFSISRFNQAVDEVIREFAGRSAEK